MAATRSASRARRRCPHCEDRPAPAPINECPPSPRTRSLSCHWIVSLSNIGECDYPMSRCRPCGCPTWLPASGLPVATVKFYLREGLLPPGEATGATRARYDDSHVKRLRLIRALTEVAGLRLEAVRTVLDTVDDDSRLVPRGDGQRAPPALGGTGRRLPDRARPGRRAGRPPRLAAVRAQPAPPRVGPRPRRPRRSRPRRGNDLLDDYAEAAQAVAERDVAAVGQDDRVAGAEHAVVGTLLLEPVLAPAAPDGAGGCVRPASARVTASGEHAGEGTDRRACLGLEQGVLLQGEEQLLAGSRPPA